MVKKQQSIIGNFSLDEFLADYYQKRPLFLPSALPGFGLPFGADELAGLSMEEGVESRLIERTRLPQPGDLGPPWQLREGPFSEDDFEALGEEEWTLLVQDVDKMVPEVHALLGLLNFLPRFSVDDIMISYATRGGSVGPHTDRYDVFLLQAQGTRRWELSTQVDENRLRTDTSLKVLEEFIPEQSFVARPGDVLYLPPGVAHYGIAQDECLTYSFGLRAPSEEAILGALVEEYARDRGERLLRTPVESRSPSPSQLSSKLFSELDQVLSALQSGEAQKRSALGRLLTEAKAHLLVDPPELELEPDELRERLNSRAKLRRNIASRFLYSPESDAAVLLFVDGGEYRLEHLPEPARLARLLCEEGSISKAALKTWNDADGSKTLWMLLAELYNLGALHFDNP